MKGIEKKSDYKIFDRKVVFGIIFLLMFGFFVYAEVEFPSKVVVQGLNIYYEKFDSDTTEFNSLNETQLRNLDNMVLEIGEFGKIEFQETMDIPSMAGVDWTVDFDSYVNISQNLVYVDNYNLPNINKEVIITLRGLSFSDPEIWNKGVICSSCELISYSGGVLVFRSPVFEGPYYAKEKPDEPVCGDGVCEGGETESNCPEDCADSGGDTGGGGGGGDVPIPGEDPEEPPEGKYDFKIFPPLMEMEIGKGTYVQKEVRVENNGTSPLNIGISVDGLSDFIFPEVRAFGLAPGEVRTIRFDIYVSDTRQADVYLGKIIFRSFYVTRNTDVVMNVKEREALFDIRTTVLKKYVNPGGRVRANISLINMGDLRNFDVNLEYKMMDFDRNVYTIKEEQFAINQTYNNIFYLDVPRDIDMGNYIFYSIVRYKDVNATSYDSFTVEVISFYAWILLILLILLLMYLVYRWYKKKQYEYEMAEYEKSKKKIEEEKNAPELKKIREDIAKEKSVDEILPQLP